MKRKKETLQRNICLVTVIAIIIMFVVNFIVYMPHWLMYTMYVIAIPQFVLLEMQRDYPALRYALFFLVMFIPWMFITRMILAGIDLSFITYFVKSDFPFVLGDTGIHSIVFFTSVPVLLFIMVKATIAPPRPVHF